MQEIRHRGRLPIIVGGTHYYTQSLLFENSLAGGKEDEDHISEHDQDKEERYPILKASPQDMLDKLREVDSVMAERWHPRDGRKIRRSLEIYLKTGKRASEMYLEQLARRRATEGQDQDRDQDDTSADEASRRPTGLRYPTLFFWTHTPRDLLKNRLQHRVDKMVEDGLINEAKGLEAHATKREESGEEVDTSRGVYIAIGYKELLPYITQLDREYNVEDGSKSLRQDALIAIEKTKTATWQYAKYQERWIRRKLLRAIGNADAQSFIHVLDTSVPDDWAQSVFESSATTVEAFLSGREMPNPSDSSALGEAQIALQEAFGSLENGSSGITKTRTCEHCDVTATTEKEWEKHIKSNRHRKTVKYKEKIAAQSAASLDVDDT